MKNKITEEIQDIKRRAGILNESLLMVMMGVAMKFKEIADQQGENAAVEYFKQKNLDEATIENLRKKYRETKGNA